MYSTQVTGKQRHPVVEDSQRNVHRAMLVVRCSTTAVERQRDRQTHIQRQADRQAGRQTDRQPDRQTDRQTDDRNEI